jgi:hypothetical protein
VSVIYTSSPQKVSGVVATLVDLSTALAAGLGKSVKRLFHTE